MSGQPIKSIYSHRCWIDGQLQPATVYMEGQKIEFIELGYRELPSALENMVLMPGVIDAHVHINEPGRTEWEGFETATKAAVAGGTTMLVDMPLNSSPVTTTVENMEKKLKASTGKIWANVGFFGGVVPGNLNNLKPLADQGVLGFKCFLTHSGIDEFPNVTLADLEAAMPLITLTSRPLLAHCELTDIPADTNLANHPGSYHEYLKSRPGIWETEAVALMVRLCKKYNCPVHIVHVSEASALSIIADAKAEGWPVTAETCPHYLLFDAEDIPDNDTLYKCAPPIRSRANNQALAEGLKSGILDFVATDHSPAPPHIKELESGNLMRAWGGIAGLQFLLPATWTALMNTMSLESVIPLLTEKPARMLRLDSRKGYIRPRYDADLIIWDPTQKFTVRQEDILHRHKASPYVGKELYGRVINTIVNGTTVFGPGSTPYPQGQAILTS